MHTAFLDLVAEAATPAPSDIEHARTLVTAAQEHLATAFAIDDKAVLTLLGANRHVDMKTNPRDTAHRTMALESLRAAVAADDRLQAPARLALDLRRVLRETPTWLLGIAGCTCFEDRRQDVGVYDDERIVPVIARCRAVERSGIMPDELPGAGWWRAEVGLAKAGLPMRLTVVAHGDTADLAVDNAVRAAALCRAVLNPHGGMELRSVRSEAPGRLYRESLIRLSESSASRSGKDG